MRLSEPVVRDLVSERKLDQQPQTLISVRTGLNGTEY